MHIISKLNYPTYSLINIPLTRLYLTYYNFQWRLWFLLCQNIKVNNQARSMNDLRLLTPVSHYPFIPIIINENLRKVQWKRNMSQGLQIFERSAIPGDRPSLCTLGFILKLWASLGLAYLPSEGNSNLLVRGDQLLYSMVRECLLHHNRYEMIMPHL